MKCTILLAVYNGEKHLPALLASLQAQTDSDFTVLIQDDGSQDKTSSILSEICAQDARFVQASHSGEHLGAAGNFLSLIRQTDADCALLCDQDDIWMPEKLAKLKSALAEAISRYGAETPLLVHSDCIVINEKGEPVLPSFFRHQGWDPEATSLSRLLVQNNVTGCTLIMNRPLLNLIAAHGRAKDLFMHDWFIALTAAAFGHIVFLDEPLTGYRQHGDNVVGASKNGLLIRAAQALTQRKKAKRRILLTYTHTRVFCRLYGDLLPAEARRITDEYLKTREMSKIPRVLAVHRIGCTMQSRVTRLGQFFFG